MGVQQGEFFILISFYVSYSQHVFINIILVNYFNVLAISMDV